MSWAWTLPLHVTPTLLLPTPPLRPEWVRVVVPTFRDWEEARETIDSLLECQPRPAEIVLVNDNADPAMPVWVAKYPIHLVNYHGNRGPSYARNAGATLDTGTPIDWLYFTDTGCSRARDFFTVLARHRSMFSTFCVAIAGPVLGVCRSALVTPINFYMTEEAILNPPFDCAGPQAVVTANAAVSAAAFRATGGFDETYPFAAGEDLDLGVRLRRFGSIGWAPDAVVRHRFVESLDDFRRRFQRYGAGTAHLQHRLALTSLRPRVLAAKHPQMQCLADMHIAAMQYGFDAHCERLSGQVPRQVRHDLR